MRCIAAAAASRCQRVVPTLLAHLVPPERAASRDGFVAELCHRLIPMVGDARLATSVDVYCDEGAFTLAEAQAIFAAARAAGAVRGASQFRDLGAAGLILASRRAVGRPPRVSDAGAAALARPEPSQ